MEKRNTRRYERKAVYLETKIISDSDSYFGFIKNVSEYGASVETYATNALIDFLPGKILQLEFKIPSGETIIFPFEITWLYTKRIRLYGLLNSFGMEIFYSPLKYREFVKTIH